MKTHIIVIAALVTVATSFEAVAAAPAASCTLQSTSRLDGLLNPPKGSDERFFTAGSGPPNIMMLLDTSCSMSWWPLAWSNNGFNSFASDSSGVYPGCRQVNVDALGYNKLVSYARMWINLTTESPWFIPSSYYQFDGTGGGTQVSFNMWLDPVNFTVPPTGTTINLSDTAACNAVTGGDPTALNPCKTCLANKGYFQYADNRRLAIGNFLNFYAPRGQGALNSITNVMRSATKARFGVIAFSAGSATPGTRQWNGFNAVNLFAPMGPSCANSLLPAQIAANSSSIISKLANGVRFNTNTPLDQYLYGAMHYFRGNAGIAGDPFPTFFPLGWPTDPGFNDSLAPSNPAVCFECGFSAMILLTDGQPNQFGFDPPAEIRALPTPCPPFTAPACGGKAAAANSTGQVGRSHIFRTADWAWNHDLRPELAGQQRIATYTVAYALNDADTLALLNATAVAGGGNFYLATNSSQLTTALSAIINDVTNRNISFSSSSIASFQTGSTSSAILPRMAPGKNNLPWIGSLWRFNQFNEFVENFDKNGDGDMNDIFVVDSTGYVIGTDYSAIPIPGDIVIEDSTGAFVKQATPAIPAVPFYEARAKLLTLANDSTRNILTVLDDSADGRLNSADTVVNFSVANATNLAPYLGILGTSFCPALVAAGSASCVGGDENGESCTVLADCLPGGFCPAGTSDDGDMLKKFGRTIAQQGTLLGLPITTQTELDTLCVNTLIQFVRGRDMGDEDGDGNRAELRPSVLGDIFHSSPIVVDPPVDRFICDLVVNYQCVTTLFNQRLGIPATPLDSRSVARCGNAAAPTDAYDEYLHVNRRRDKVILVGANDGMLHAFRESVATETQGSGLCTVKYEPSDGQEMWAFIPPDQLSRLRELVLGHAYFIDGDVMVRDIWADGSGAIVPVADGKKQADEYHTVAVVAEGRGGIHYFALDIRATPTPSGVAGGGGILNPKFLWLFPQPDSEEASLVGKSLLSITPKAPPIGPVLLKHTTPPVGIAARYGGTEERWVTMLSGGWSPGNEKGRGVYMVDVWNPVAKLNGAATGRTDNLLWKMDYDENGNGNQLQPTRALRYSVVAPIGMADFGSNASSLGDGFFDTAVFGDLAGQVWVARMYMPGEITGSGKLIDNWAGARAFQMDRDGVAAGNSKSVRNRQPFYYLPTLIIQPDTGALRAMLGTGDRLALLDSNAGECRYDNPLACAKYGCDVEVKYKIDRLGFKVDDDSLKWKNTGDEQDRLQTSGSGSSACGTPGSVEVKAKIEKNDVKQCPKQGGGNDDFNDIRKIDVDCGQSSSGNFSCKRVDSNTDNLVTLNWPIENFRLVPGVPGMPGYLGNNRFYAMRVYGGLGGQVFDETATSGIVQNPNQFDSNRITDRTSAQPTRGDLVDVTGTTCDATGFCTCGTPPCQALKDGLGWLVDYSDGLSHKTGGGASVPTGGCLLWNVVYPTTTVAACSTSAAKSRFFQAQYLTGEPNCAEGLRNIGANTWDRYQERSVLAPPPEPSTAIAINKVTGQIKYSGVVLEPGQSQATEVVVSKGADLLQSISSLPLSRQEHLCRHVDRKYCLTSQP